MAAAAWQRHDKLRTLVHSMLNFEPCQVSLAVTGLGRLLNDSDIWTGLDELSLSVLGAVKTKWRDSVQVEKCHLQGRKKIKCVLADMKLQPFLVTVEALQRWLLSIDAVPVDGHIARRVAIWLVNAGFKHWSHLVGLDIDDLHPGQEFVHISDLALLRRAIEKACSLNASSNSGSGLLPVPTSSTRPSVVNADAEASKLQPAMLLAAEADWEAEVQRVGVPGLSTTLRPAQAIAALASARTAGLDVHTCLSQRVAFLKTETQRRSLPSVVCGLKSWHVFATSVCGYHESCTLPPVRALDVMKYLSIFRNSGTGCNYISYIKWMCLQLGLSTDWHSDELKLTMKGAKKLAVRTGSTSLVDRKLLDDDLLGKLVALADLKGLSDWSCQAIMCWEFLLRVQSEAIELELGNAGDATALDPDRHSGVWFDAATGIVLRLQRRKHRPKGSLLRRTCTCRVLGSTRCVVHRLMGHCAHLKTSQRLFSHTAPTFLKTLRRLLGLLGVPAADEFTLKTFRSGKATALARAGAPLGQILAAGEWRSKAFLNYVDEDAFDASQVLACEFENSDDES